MTHSDQDTLADEKADVSQVENYGGDSIHDEHLSTDPEEQKRLTKSILRKLDTRMLPMLALLFLFSFLDRCVFLGMLQIYLVTLLMIV